jgi:nitrate/nitrite transporter NarK
LFVLNWHFARKLGGFLSQLCSAKKKLFWTVVIRIFSFALEFLTTRHGQKEKVIEWGKKRPPSLGGGYEQVTDEWPSQRRTK